MTVSAFRVQVTGLVFVFKLASLTLKQVPTCIPKPKTNTFDKSIKFLHWFQMVLGCLRLFQITLGWFRLFQIVLGRFESFQLVLTLVSTLFSIRKFNMITICTLVNSFICFFYKNFVGFITPAVERWLILIRVVAALAPFEVSFL